VGSGASTTHPKIEDGNKLIDITEVVRDINDRAYIPGASIKGNIRAWLEGRGLDADIIEELFGSKDMEKVDSNGNKIAVGGKAVFWNAYALNGQDISYDTPYWRLGRLTDVTVSVAIDRNKRTAVEEKLFYQEFVPPEVAFEMTIIIQNACEDEIALLLYALKHGFSDENPITIGASTSNGWGRFNCQIKDISKMDESDVEKWLKSDSSTMSHDAFTKLKEEEKQKLMEKVDKITSDISDDLLELRLRLSFEGSFLVNDPGQVVKKETPDHIPRKNHAGKIVLPAESFRGAFRSQAERIIRTLGGEACGPGNPCKALDKPCTACKIFGATGRKSLVSFTDFVQCNEEETKIQEFVAIDRFTGGGAEKLKFNAKSVLNPVFEGTITIDKRKIKQWMIGLLALTFRDLMEGDITFGFGASKGYGKCKACITNISLTDKKEFINLCINEFRKKMVRKKEASRA